MEPPRGAVGGGSEERDGSLGKGERGNGGEGEGGAGQKGRVVAKGVQGSSGLRGRWGWGGWLRG